VDQATSRGASSSARPWQSMRRAEVLRNRPQAREDQGEARLSQPTIRSLGVRRKIPNGPETMAGDGEEDDLGSPGGRMGRGR